MLPGTVRQPQDFTLSGANGIGASWNSAVESTAGAWSFGSGAAIPALVYADYDGGGGAYSCSDYPANIPGSQTPLECGNTPVGGYRPRMLEIPTFSPPGGTVAATETLTISINNNEAAIHYSLDGSSPSASGPRYDGALSFASLGAGTHSIRAIAVKADHITSALASATFIVGMASDVDSDDDGLIDINNLNMLHNMRYNLAGTGYDDDFDDGPGNLGTRTGASTTEPAACNDGDPTTTITLCGYELMRNLDFGIAADYASGSVNADWRPNRSDPERAGNAGFSGIDGFNAIFEGNGHSISNLYSRGSGRVGLFKLLNPEAVIRNVDLVGFDVYGGSRDDDKIGGLAGENKGTIVASHAAGNAAGSGGGDDKVGGLVGQNYGRIRASRASTGNRDGGGGDNDNVGGLVGWNSGPITASYAAGATAVDGGDGSADNVGGLVGWNRGRITAAYVSNNTAGGGGSADKVGGLVGYNHSTGTVRASYATGNADGGDGDQDRVGGLLGLAGGTEGTTITDSYAFGTATGETAGHDGSDKPESSPGVSISSCRRPHSQ